MKNNRFVVYKVTNKINGKIYIGVHKTKNINDNYLGSGVAITRAVNKYGYDNFKKVIIIETKSEDIAYWFEKMIVDENFVNDTSTYNMTLGGIGGFSHIDTSGSDNGMYGKGYKLSGIKNGRHKDNFKGDLKEIGQKISKAIKGNHTYLNTKTNKLERINIKDRKTYHKDLNDGMVSCKDSNGNSVYITSEEYNKNKNNYSFHTKGKAVYYDLELKKLVSIKTKDKIDNKHIHQSKKIIIKRNYKNIIISAKDMLEEDIFVSSNHLDKSLL